MTEKDVCLTNKPNLFPIFPTNRMRHVRTIRGLTQQELARRVGTTQATISYIERGDAIAVKPAMRKRIARALGINRYWLFDENGRLRP